jgi:hypothetical protein
MSKTTEKIGIVIVIIVIALFLNADTIKNGITKIILTAYIENIIDLDVNIKDIDISFSEDWADIKELKIFNPSGFKDKVMADISQIYVDYDLDELIKGRFHIKELRIDLNKLFIVKNIKRKLNLNLIEAIQPKEKELKDEKEESREHRFRIDVLKLKVGKVIYKNYPVNLPIIEREFNIDIDERYEDITDPSALAGLILSKIFLSNKKVARLVAPDMDEVREEIVEALRKAMELFPETEQEQEKPPEEQEEKTSEHPEQILPLGVK